jgi:KDO2-lipid IV(A) lauroyltransferase
MLADLRFILDSRLRRRVLAKLRQVLGPSVPEERIRSLARAVFRNFAGIVLDLLRDSSARCGCVRLRVRGWRHLVAARSRGHGVILLTAHLGPWEMGGALLAGRGVPFSAVARPHRDSRVTRFFDRIRERAGVSVIAADGAVHEALDVLRRNGIVALLADRVARGSGAEVPFFGRSARLCRSPAALALRTGACILPAFALHGRDGRLRLVFDRPIVPRRRGGEGSMEWAVTRCAAALERRIRLHPDQWFAFERIWDETPGPGRLVAQA